MQKYSIDVIFLLMKFIKLKIEKNVCEEINEQWRTYIKIQKKDKKNPKIELKDNNNFSQTKRSIKFLYINLSCRLDWWMPYYTKNSHKPQIFLIEKYIYQLNLLKKKTKKQKEFFYSKG